MTVTFLGVGSNLGDRRLNIQRATELLTGSPGISRVRTSQVYETEPVGGPPQGRFLNAVVGCVTSLTAYELLSLLQEIESRLGRERSARWGPRMIDLDILLFGIERHADKRLTVPHPRMWEREFVLRPLEDLAPSIVHAGREAWMPVMDVLQTQWPCDAAHTL